MSTETNDPKALDAEFDALFAGQDQDACEWYGIDYYRKPTLWAGLDGVYNAATLRRVADWLDAKNSTA